MKLLKILKTYFFPRVKKCKNYTVYRIRNNDKPTLILANYSNTDGFVAPKETGKLILVQNPNLDGIDLTSLTNLQNVSGVYSCNEEMLYREKCKKQCSWCNGEFE